jgi:hypothetical protein
VQACPGKLGEVADVVQPRGCLEKLFVGGRSGGEAARPGGHALDVRPAPREGALQEVAGEVFGPGGKRLHVIEATQLARDVHGRDVPSGDV